MPSKWTHRLGFTAGALTRLKNFMQISDYYTTDRHLIHFTRQQASDFAKGVANDYNPIHDIDAKRFCVPGDLLFAVALSKMGLSKTMNVQFADMVGDGIKLEFPESNSGPSSVCDEGGKHYLDINRQGENTQDEELIANLSREYVAFSGQTFPHILVPLWKQHQVMINPARPLVIYQSMSIELDTLDLHHPTLEVAEVSLEPKGKRGDVSLGFNFVENGKVVGHGEKRMVLSGLRAYDQEQVEGVVDFYNERKTAKV